MRNHLKEMKNMPGHHFSSLRRAMLGGLLLLAVAMPLAGCGPKGKGEMLDEALIQTATKGELVETIVESGKITPWYEVKIKAKVSGEVKTVLVKEGEVVTAGQLLMTLDDVDYKRQVALGQVDFEEARLSVRNAQLELERNKAAFEARGISKYELDRTEQALELAQVRLQRTRVSLETRRDQLGYTRISSPMDGVVTMRNVEPGEIVTAGVTATVNGEPLLTVARMDKLQLELNLNQVDVARVKPGQSATVTLDAFRDKPVKGEVTTIAASAHTDTSKGVDVFEVKISVDPSTAGVEIKPGMTAEVKIHVSTHPQVVKVPLEAIFEEKGKQYIYVIKEDPAVKGKKKEKTEITVGGRSSDEVEVTKGLQAGQAFYIKGETKDMELKM